MVHILQNKRSSDKNKTFFKCNSGLWEPGPASAWLRVTSACDEPAVMSRWGHPSPRRWSDCVNADSRGEERLSRRSKTNQKKKNTVVSYCLLFCWNGSFGRTNEDAAAVPPTSASSINTPERVAPLMSDNELLHRRKWGTIWLKGTFASASRKEDRLLQSPPPPHRLPFPQQSF